MLIVICLIIGLAVGLATASSHTFLDGEDFLFGFMGAMGGAVVGVVLVIFLVAANDKESNIITRTEDTPIYSLETTSQYESSFILGIGGGESNIKYYFYAEDENGLYSLESLNAEDTKIKEDNSIAPCVRTQYSKFKSDIVNWLLFGEMQDSKILVIPVGTIKKQFNVSIK